MATSFSNKKALRFVITLSTGKFGSSNNDRITLHRPSPGKREARRRLVQHCAPE